jgi:hypothetical protein
VSNASAHLASRQMSALAQLPTASPYPEVPRFDKGFSGKKVLETPRKRFFGVSLNSWILHMPPDKRRRALRVLGV